MTDPNIEILNSFSELRARLSQYDTLHAATTNDIFCTLEWFELLHSDGLTSQRIGNAQCQLILLSHPEQSSLICLPLMGTSVLKSLSNFYSSLFSYLAWSTTGKETPSAIPGQADSHAICQYLFAHTSRWPVITLSPMDITAPFFVHMRSAFEKAGYWSDTYFCFGNWYLNVANHSFQTYFATLPSALRHSIERGQRRLSRHGIWDIQIHQKKGVSLESAIADFVSVYSQSWKTAEPNPLFIPQLIRMAGAKEWLRLGVLTLDGRPIAAQIWFVLGNKASIYKLAYVAGFERFSAGSVLTHAMMRQVIDIDHVKEVDYLTGDDVYKRDWMSHRRERHGLVAFHPQTLLGLLHAIKHFAGKRLKTVRQQST